MKLDIYIITVNKEKVKLDPVKFIVHLVINMGGWIYHRYLYPNFNIFPQKIQAEVSIILIGRDNPVTYHSNPIICKIVYNSLFMYIRN